MAQITGLGTTYNMPNYTGILYGLTPADTPFFSAIGGLSGGGQSIATEFEWSSFDLRDASQKVRLEGQDAPAPEERVRAYASNITEIHQETVGVSYTKLAAYGNLAGLNIAGQVNPVINELDWQVRQMLTQMVMDIEYSFLQGVYNKPSDNTTPRATRGLLNAIATNVSAQGTVITASSGTATASTDVVTFAAHGLANGDKVTFSALTGAAGLALYRTYFVRDVTTNTFKVAAAAGGPAIDITTDGTGVGIVKNTAVTRDIVDSLMQLVYSNGGIMESGTATLLIPPALKAALSKAYITSNNYMEQSRTVGGVNVTTLITDFGTLNIMMDRHMPQDTVAVVSMEECSPVYLEVPGKGHFFAEPLAKTGAYDKVQLYGEVGLAYGNERRHGLITGLSV